MQKGLSSSPPPRTCVITGTGGYLGGRFRTALGQRGWRVRGLVKHPSTSLEEIAFRLGEPLESGCLMGAEALVHCAYDFGPRTWPEIERVNVRGSERLFAAALAAGVSRIIYLSSLSAFEGCRSLYGRAKLTIEGIAKGFEATMLRPGLVYGEPAAGLYGRLVTQVNRSRILPVVGGNQLQYLVHDQDLANLVCRYLEGQLPATSSPVAVAHEQPQSMRAILEAIAGGVGRKPLFLPLPWRPAWLALRIAEAAGLRPGFRSDSVVSLMYPNPKPDFGAMHELGFRCRPFHFVPTAS